MFLLDIYVLSELRKAGYQQLLPNQVVLGMSCIVQDHPLGWLQDRQNAQIVQALGNTA
jgi:hypothetical protein